MHERHHRTLLVGRPEQEEPARLEHDLQLEPATVELATPDDVLGDDDGIAILDLHHTVSIQVLGFHIAASSTDHRWIAQPSSTNQSTAASTNWVMAMSSRPCSSCPRPGMKKLPRAATTFPVDPCPATMSLAVMSGVRLMLEVNCAGSIRVAAAMQFRQAPRRVHMCSTSHPERGERTGGADRAADARDEDTLKQEPERAARRHRSPCGHAPAAKLLDALAAFRRHHEHGENESVDDADEGAGDDAEGHEAGDGAPQHHVDIGPTTTLEDHADEQPEHRPRNAGSDRRAQNAP